MQIDWVLLETVLIVNILISPLIFLFPELYLPQIHFHTRPYIGHLDSCIPVGFFGVDRDAPITGTEGRDII